MAFNKEKIIKKNITSPPCSLSNSRIWTEWPDRSCTTRSSSSIRLFLNYLNLENFSLLYIICSNKENRCEKKMISY